MSLTELYSAMLQQVAERRRRQLERGSVAGDSPQPVLVEESHRIRALELENAQIKAGFSAFVNLLMKKGILQHGDLARRIAELRGEGFESLFRFLFDDEDAG